MATQTVLRRYQRREVRSLAFAVAEGFAEKLILLDLSEGGMAVQASERLTPARVLRLKFALPSGATVLPATAEVVWSDASGRAGLRFVRLPQAVLAPIHRWLLSPEAPVLVEPSHRPRIHARPKDAQPLGNSGRISAPLAAHNSPTPLLAPFSRTWFLATVIDGVLVALAVNLFGLSAYLLAGALPRDDKLVGTAIFLLVFCLALYRVVFFPQAQRTPGKWLVRALSRIARRLRRDTVQQLRIAH
jgi:hypothetical protein